MTTIKRLETTGSIDDDGDVFDDRGNNLGRAQLSLTVHRRVLDAGSQQDPNAELRGIPRPRGNIRFVDGTVAFTAVASKAELTIRMDNGGTVRFQIVSTDTGEIRIINIE